MQCYSCFIISISFQVLKGRTVCLITQWRLVGYVHLMVSILPAYFLLPT